MATSNTVTVSDRLVVWTLKDATGSSGAAAAICWFNAVAGVAADHARQPPDTGTWWNVKTITYLPATASASGTTAILNEKDGSGPILFQVTLGAGDIPEVYTQTYDPYLRCRPCWYSSNNDAWTTGSAWVFQLA